MNARPCRLSHHPWTAGPAWARNLALGQQVPPSGLQHPSRAISGITRYLWLHFLGALVSVFLLALYLSLRQETPVIAEGLHLHETHVPPSMRRRHEDSQQSATVAADHGDAGKGPANGSGG